MPLTDAQLITMTSAAVLLAQHAAVLSDFEAEMIAEVGSRFGRFRRDATVTETEWLVIEAAVAAMRGAQARARVAEARAVARERAA